MAPSNPFMEDYKMVSLVDIGKLRESVELRGKKVEIQGVTAAVIMQLLSESDELRRILAQKSLGEDMVGNLINQAPLTVAKMIACATGKAEDAETIEFALRELTAGETYDLMKVILKLTFPRPSFVEELTGLARKAEERGWAVGMKSPAQSSAASEQDTTSTTAGTTRQDNSEHGANSSNEKN